VESLSRRADHDGVPSFAARTAFCLQKSKAAGDREYSKSTAISVPYVHQLPEITGSKFGGLAWDQRAAARCFAGLAAGLTACFGAAGAASQPPAGPATLIASSGCGSGVKVWIASLAAACDCGSRRFETSSRLRVASESPWAAARLNHLNDSARFCSTPIPRA